MQPVLALHAEPASKDPINTWSGTGCFLGLEREHAERKCVQSPVLVSQNLCQEILNLSAVKLDPSRFPVQKAALRARSSSHPGSFAPLWWDKGI